MNVDNSREMKANEVAQGVPQSELIRIFSGPVKGARVNIKNGPAAGVVGVH